MDNKIKLYDLLGWSKNDMTMALHFLNIALQQTEEERQKLIDKGWEDDVVKINDFIIAIEKAICDIEHILPEIKTLMEDL